MPMARLILASLLLLGAVLGTRAQCNAGAWGSSAPHWA